MTQQPPNPAGPALNLRGAVDLSALSRPAPTAGAAGGAAGSVGTDGSDALIVQVTEESFPELVQRSTTVPVVIDLGSARSPASSQLTSALETLVAEYGGRFLLAQVDVDTLPQIAAAFQVTAVPAACAVLAGQPVPLFQGAPPIEQLRQLLDELLRVAAENGVNGRIDVDSADESTDAATEDEPEEEPLPPLHQQAYEAIERDDLDAAVAAYEQALGEDPRDEMAAAGLAQVRLMVRTRGVDAAAARAAAANDPADVPAQLLMADLDVFGGHVEDAFSRLIETVKVTAGDDRAAVRTHLLELFAVVGAADPRVAKARTALANALF